MEEFYPVLRREIFFAGIQDAGIGIGSLIRCCNLSHVCLQTDNHRLFRHAETLHFMGGNAHDERFACTYLVIAYSATVLLDHPNTILLRGIDTADAIAQLQSFHVEVRKSLVTAVVLRADKAVELLVIHLRQSVLELTALTFKPFRKAIADFINL